MLGYREPQDQAPPPTAEQRVRHEPATVPESERLERLLAGLVVSRPCDDAICTSLLKRNLLVTQLAA